MTHGHHMDLSHMATARRKEREKDRRRIEIIDAAERLFFEKGFEGMSMDDVAKATELAKGTLYLYFKNKESLFFAVASRGAMIMKELFIEGINKGINGADKLYSTGESYYRFYKEYPDYYRLFIYSQSPCFCITEESAPELQMLGRETIEIMCRCIVEGQSDGSINPGLDPIKTAFFLIFSSQGVINQSAMLKAAIEANGISQDEFVRFSLDLMGNGVSKTKNWRNIQ
jgi:TetR/AcrR family transcriptional regulator